MMEIVAWAIPIVVVAFASINAWLLYRASEGRKDRQHLTDRIDAADRRHTDFQQVVYQEYVRTSALKQIEDRLVAAVERIGDRLDRMFEVRHKRDGEDR